MYGVDYVGGVIGGYIIVLIDVNFVWEFIFIGLFFPWLQLILYCVEYAHLVKNFVVFLM